MPVLSLALQTNTPLKTRSSSGASFPTDPSSLRHWTSRQRRPFGGRRTRASPPLLEDPRASGRTKCKETRRGDGNAARLINVVSARHSLSWLESPATSQKDYTKDEPTFKLFLYTDFPEFLRACQARVEAASAPSLAFEACRCVSSAAFEMARRSRRGRVLLRVGSASPSSRPETRETEGILRGVEDVKDPPASQGSERRNRGEHKSKRRENFRQEAPTRGFSSTKFRGKMFSTSQVS